MAKRFTDTDKWKDPWFQDLPIKYKIMWFYLLDNCNLAGIWKVNVRLASFQIGEPFESSEILRIFKGRITDLGEGKWFINKFIEFQYGKLSVNCKPHIPVINLLKEHKIKGYLKGIETLKEKDKEKDKDMDKEKDKENELFELFWNQYHQKSGKPKTDREPSLKHWKKLNKKEQQMAIDNIDAYCKTQNDSEYLKKARTYLADKTFTDEMSIVETKEFTGDFVI